MNCCTEVLRAKKLKKENEEEFKKITRKCFWSRPIGHCFHFKEDLRLVNGTYTSKGWYCCHCPKFIGQRTWRERNYPIFSSFFEEG